MAHPVICVKCGQQFDRDKEQAVKVGGRRYAHYKCEPNGELVPLPQPKQEKEKKEVSTEDEDLKKLKTYIEHLYGANNVRWPLVMKQIQQYKKEYAYTYSGMLKSLVWFYEIKGNHIELSKGVGIIPYAYQDAYNYYYSLFVAQSRNEKKDFQQITSKVREITIKSPEVKKKEKFFNQDGEDKI